MDSKLDKMPNIKTEQQANLVPTTPSSSSSRDTTKATS
jgi:hypothetical protein